MSDGIQDVNQSNSSITEGSALPIDENETPTKKQNENTRTKQRKGIEIKTDEELVTFSLEHVKRNFKEMANNVRSYSPPEVIHGLIWRFNVCKTLNASTKKTWLSFFLCCEPVSKKAERTWSCLVHTARLTMLNNDSSNNSEKVFRYHVFYANANSWGYEKFYDWDEVCDPTNDFIENEIVSFKVSVTADYPKNVLCEESDLMKELTADLRKDINSLNAELADFRTVMNLFNTDLMKELKDLQQKFDELKPQCSVDTERETKEDKNVTDTNDKKLSEPVVTISKDVVENEIKSCAFEETIKQNTIDDLLKENASNENENNSVEITKHVTPPDTSLNFERSHYLVPDLHCGLNRAICSGTKSPWFPCSCYESRQLPSGFHCGFRPSCHEILPYTMYQRCQCQFPSLANWNNPASKLIFTEEKPVNSESKSCPSHLDHEQANHCINPKRG